MGEFLDKFSLASLASKFFVKSGPAAGLLGCHESNNRLLLRKHVKIQG